MTIHRQQPNNWPDRRLTELLDITHPLIQAPMAGANDAKMVIAAANAGALGSLPCGMLGQEQMRAQIGIVRQQTSQPLNLNFFCHNPATPDPARDAAWKSALLPYYEELGLDPDATAPAVNRAPFDTLMCAIVEDTKPEVVSFHYGLPNKPLLDRVKATGAKILSSATTVAEAIWLEDNGCDVIIAQGNEAGGHRGMFLTDDVNTQAGTFSLVPQIVDAVKVPVVAAGGIADGRGIAAAFALGAAGAQIGTAYLFTPEATISDLHRAALKSAGDNKTAVTNLFSGRPARGVLNRLMREIGPMSVSAPAFPTAGTALAPLKAAAEAKSSDDFSSLWSGQSVGLGEDMTAAELTEKLARDTLATLGKMGSG